MIETTSETWQLLFNLAFSGFLGILALWFRNINSEIKSVQKEIRTLHERINNSAEGLRRDHVDCQRTLPDLFVPRRELENILSMFRTDLGEIKLLLQELQRERRKEKEERA
jgi:hypothetical protein